MPLLYTKDPLKPDERVVYYQSSSGKRHMCHPIQPGMSFACKVFEGVQRAKPFAGARGVPAPLPNQPPRAAQKIKI
jgi:hypothetical protein